ncbi:class I SAM-dependent methyltransferase [Alphaproteobacteria bacterium]|nr:class I SAM-dependent methyltransferase [Alphaproteobacteria bacterium]
MLLEPFLPSSALENKDEGGKWSLKENIPERWEMSYENIKFYAMPTAFRHLGFFPDQSPHWIWTAQKINKFILNTSTPNVPRILNLFGYSGLASLHAASNGASITHVDASKKAISFAFENRNLSSFSNLPIKYLTDDALKFVKKEIRRENKYDAIILDPPKYGRGPNGEKWELQKDLPILLNLLPQILSKNPLFVILNSYAIRSSYSSLHYALREAMKTYKGKVESGEISIFEDQDDPREISTAIFARWESKNIN